MFYFYLGSKTGIFILRWNIHRESINFATKRAFKLSLFFSLSLFKLNHRSFNFRLDQDRNFYLLKKTPYPFSHQKPYVFREKKKTRTTAMLKMCLFNSENIKATSPLIDWFSSSNEIFFIHIEIWNIFSTNFRCSGTLAFAQF